MKRRVRTGRITQPSHQWGTKCNPARAGAVTRCSPRNSRPWSQLTAAARSSTWTVVAATIATAGCALSPSADPTLAPTDADTSRWERVVYGIDVWDEEGDQIAHPFLGGFNVPRPQLADADGDGDLDLFLQEIGDRVMFFENIGGAKTEPSFRWVTDRFAGLSVGEWFRFVDVDLDGDLDLLAEQPFSYLRYYRNDGGAGPASYVLAADTLKDVDGTPIFSDRQNIPNAADIDCDGKLDLLIGRLTGTITRYEAADVDESGVPRFIYVTDSFENIEIVAEIQGSLHGANTMALGDIDLDGDHDLLWGDFFEAGLLLIENTGTCERPVLRGQPKPFPLANPVATSGYNAPALGDLDLDGDVDLAMGVLGGAFNPNRSTVENLYFLRQTDDGFEVASPRLIQTVDVGSESIPALADLDGDGDYDLLLSNKIEPGDTRAGRIFVFENTGSASSPAFTARGLAPGMDQAYHYAPAFGDLDGDGDLDMLLGQWRDEIAYYRNDGPALRSTADPAQPHANASQAIYAQTLPRWTIVDSVAAELTRGSNTTPALGDLDNDGDLDLIVGEASGVLNYYRNDGDSQRPDFQLVSDNYLDIDVGRRSTPTLADLDGDGDLDLGVGSESSGLFVYMNEGTPFAPKFVESDPLAAELPSFAAPVFVDIDADGDLDLISGGGGGGVVIYRRH